MIELVTQENDDGCAHACIAMVTGLIFEHVWTLHPHQMTSDDIVHMLAHLRYVAEPVSHGIPDGLSLMTVPSLNELGCNHVVVMEVDNNQFRLYDPNKGRQNRKWYDLGEHDGDMSRFILKNWSEVMRVQLNRVDESIRRRFHVKH